MGHSLSHKSQVTSKRLVTSNQFQVIVLFSNLVLVPSPYMLALPASPKPYGLMGCLALFRGFFLAMTHLLTLCLLGHRLCCRLRASFKSLSCNLMLSGNDSAYRNFVVAFNLLAPPKKRIPIMTISLPFPKFVLLTPACRKSIL